MRFEYSGNVVELDVQLGSNDISSAMQLLHHLMHLLNIDAKFMITSFTQGTYEPPIPSILISLLPSNSAYPFQCNVHTIESIQSSILKQSLPPPISLSAMNGQSLIHSFSSHGYARLRLDPDDDLSRKTLEIIRAVKEQTPAFFNINREEKLRTRTLCTMGGGRWGEGGEASKRRPFVGYSPDQGGREFIQVRRYDGIFPWPHGRGKDSIGEETELHLYARFFDSMDVIARQALRAISSELKLGEIEELLDPKDDLPWIEGEWEQPLGTRILRSVRIFARNNYGWKWLNNLLPTPPLLKRSGASVHRIYKYYKDKDLPPSAPSTSLHSDMGLITIAPKSDLRGLMVFNSNEGIMLDVEADQSGDLHELICFPGEALGLITGGRVKAPVHYVEEGGLMGRPRFSFPFFLRPRPEADLSPFIDPSILHPLAPLQDQGLPLTYGMFIERVMWKDRAWSPKPGSSNSPLGSDY